VSFENLRIIISSSTNIQETQDIKSNMFSIFYSESVVLMEAHGSSARIRLVAPKKKKT
jgi:hypothetical protein